MQRIVFYMLITHVTFLLSACSNSKENTLAVLPEVAPPTQAAPPALQRENAIKNYRDYLEKNQGRAFANNALRRLADLELESGESLISLEDSKEINHGKRTLLSAIEHYNTYLKTYPDNRDNDLVLYAASRTATA